MATQEELLGTDIEDYKFSPRAQRCLRHSSRCKLGVIKTLGDVVSRSGEELLKIKNFGEGTLNHIREVLAEDRLYLRGEGLGDRGREWPGQVG